MIWIKCVSENTGTRSHMYIEHGLICTIIDISVLPIWIKCVGGLDVCPYIYTHTYRHKSVYQACRFPLL